MKIIDEYNELKLLARKLGVTRSNDTDESKEQLLWDVRAFISINYKIWINVFSEIKFGEIDFNKIEVIVRNGLYK